MNHLIVLLILSGWFSVLLTAEESFKWVDNPGVCLDLKYGDRSVIRYQYEAIDESTPERRHDTYKPFYHVYDWEGEGFITKGPGGKFTHHRGIFFGFSKCSYTQKDGKTISGIDTWHCKKAHQVHRKILEQKAGKENASLKTEIGWISNEGLEFITEERSLSFRFKGEDLIVEFRSVLNARFPEVKVDGDPQHAGFQFRASNEVAEETASQTYYVRPGTGKGKLGQTVNWTPKSDTKSTRNLPWKIMSVVIGGHRYSILYLDSEENPKPARFSERDYGRFGSYFVKEFTAEAPLEVNYKLVIRKGEMELGEVEEFRG